MVHRSYLPCWFLLSKERVLSILFPYSPQCVVRKPPIEARGLIKSLMPIIWMVRDKHTGFQI